MTTLLDDQALSQYLRGTRRLEGPVFTTGLWYVRLSQAVLKANQPGTGKLSRPISALPEPAQLAAIQAIITLPESIGLLSLRTLALPIARLREHHQLNLLSIEALAAASELAATVVLTTPSPKLETALVSEGLSISA